MEKGGKPSPLKKQAIINKKTLAFSDVKSIIIMKKAKIFVSAFAVLALVAGALAFKASKSQTVFCGTTNGSTPNTTACTIFTPSTYTPSSTGSSFCTNDDSQGSTCSVKAKPPVHN
jgi:hypothetical protein